jgi:GrpB-like predicted nucleotidyltransferase (UPF0157 family)
VNQTPIRLVAYDPAWPRHYERERERLDRAIGDRVEAFAHVGSTAVAGLAAKPTIDVAALVADAGRATDCIAPLTALGYGVGHRHDDWVYLRRERRDAPDCNLHLFPEGGGKWRDGLRFRDALRATPETRRRYEALKRDLAERHRHDSVAYSRGKAAFVAEVLERARDDGADDAGWTPRTRETGRADDEADWTPPGTEDAGGPAWR